ncbi:MAG: tRNA glutamyl-Q(34) synthetase GluQRS [Minwuia sp.]|uniref:tRNA glutamyl-Q(34) synthetase GluQRS n=1 Tax=Minwuia sp. TaxID=2493630 RepID=UPI003A868891
MSFVTRFAPSPTGPLHLGHILSALTVWDAARRADGVVLLRIEDIDAGRCKPEYETGIRDDLAWLGLTWPEPVWRQSDRLHVYRDALAKLDARGLVYPCFCSRSEIRDAAEEDGFEGPVYPGTCRDLPAEAARSRIEAGEPAAWRIRLDRALEETGPVIWTDTGAGEQRWDGDGWGDVVLGRKDSGVSYHLAAVIDDAAQGVTDVIRGHDLFTATHVHVTLQRLFGLPVPRYFHHRLLLDEEGEKLSKSKGAESVRTTFGSLGPRGVLDALMRAGAPSSLFDHLGL